VIDFQVLGGIEARIGGRPVPAKRRQQNLVLAALLIDAGRPVPMDTLIDRVWGDQPPRHARRDLQIHLARIRHQLTPLDGTSPGRLRLSRAGGGYLLDVESERVDLHQFRRLVDQAREPDCSTGERLRLLREALRLWRGDALAGLPGEWASRVRQAWRQRYVDAVVAWAEAEVDAGDPTTVIGLLADLVGQHPLVESLTTVFMRALAATGRAAQALSLYDQARRLLAEELGTDPGPELQAMHQKILRGEMAHRQHSLPRGATNDSTVPAQLPRDVHGFAGRTGHLAHLDSLLSDPTLVPTVVITAVSGTPGVGKTALAVHWAHRMADRFPDGQLYVNLHGFDPARQPTTPADVVRSFLDGLGVAPARIPATPDAQVALYRSLIAGRRILILLDNARDAEQVRPLLPDSPTATAIVTSRDQLRSLAVVDDACILPVDLLTVTEARELFGARLGVPRVAAEPEAVDRIISACGGLPIALAIVAARAAANPDFTVTDIAQELEAASGLDAFDGGDPAADVRSVFSWSYATLSAPAARLFRLLGLCRRADIGVGAAASITGQPPRYVRRLLTELVRANLLTELVPGRYALHDLLRAYADELVEAYDPEGERQAALTRLLDHYTHTAYTADRLLDPHRDAISVPLAAAAPGVHAEHLADQRAATAWLRTEHDVLLATLRYAGPAGFATHAWQLAWALDTFLKRQGRHHERADIWKAALAAARRLGDLDARASAQRRLGWAYTRLGRYAEAEECLNETLALYARSGDLVGQARTHCNLSYLWERHERPQHSLEHDWQALALFQAAGHRRGEAAVVNAIGWHSAMAGDHTQAVTMCQRAVGLLHEIGNQTGEAAAWDSLGYAHHRVGQYSQAVTSYHRALTLFRDLGDRYEEASTLERLGDAHLGAGDHAAAEAAYRHAVEISTTLAHPNADHIRAKLKDLNPAGDYRPA
jgi:DNA-binding SARP family transcriptional activator/tetratricopeptide (TPR) repeat protein